MTEPQSTEEFEHFHADAMVRLKNEELKLKNMETPAALVPLDDQLKQTLNRVLRSIPATGRVDPEQVFREAISLLPTLDAQRFLIDNLLEALKRGEDLKKTMDCYRALGLLWGSLEPSATQIPLTGLGVQLEERKSLWRRVALTVIQIGINAIKSIPKWIEIEPQIMLVGPVPAISFTLKGKGMTIQDFIEALRGDTISEPS